VEFLSDLRLAGDILRQAIEARNALSAADAAYRDLAQPLLESKLALLEAVLDQEPDGHSVAEFERFLCEFEVSPGDDASEIFAIIDRVFENPPLLGVAVSRILGQEAALTLEPRRALLSVAGRAFERRLEEVGGVIVTALSELAEPAEDRRDADSTRLWGELYLRLCNMNRVYLKEPARAVAAARRGLDVLAAGAGGDEPLQTVRQALQDGLQQSEIAVLEGLLGTAPPDQLTDAVARILGEGPALTLAQRRALLNVAGRAFERGLEEVGGMIVTALSELAEPAEDRRDADRTRLWGELYLRLCNMNRVYLKEPARAVAAARRGLDVLAAGAGGDEPLQTVRQALQEGLQQAEIAVLEGLLGTAPAEQLTDAVARILGEGTALTLAQRRALLNVAGQAFEQRLEEVGGLIVTALSELAEPAEDRHDADSTRLWGELYLRLCNMNRVYLKEPARVIAVARRGLDVLDNNASDVPALAEVHRGLSQHLQQVAG